jgi:hypothetical protein
MWKIVVVLLLTALAILLARLVHEAPSIETRVSTVVSVIQGGTPARLQPTLMYAGVRG